MRGCAKAFSEELPAVPAFPSLGAAVDDMVVSLEDYLEAKKLKDQFAAADSPEGKAAALLAIKHYMLRISLARAPQ